MARPPVYHGPPVTTLAPNDFTHLHVHSEFSLLDGLGRIGDLVDEAERLGFDSLALTDHGALYGSVAFYQAARAKGIKPIIGVETYVARRSMRDKEGKADAQPYHLVLLAKDLVGYRNLCRLVTDAHLEGYYYKPRIDREHLARYSEGLIGMSACLGGEIPKALEIDDWESARRLAGEYGEILGKGNFFLELQDHGIPLQRRLNEQLLRLAPEVGLPLAVTNDLHYVHRAQSEAHDVLLCVGTGSNIDTPGRLRFETDAFYLKSTAEMAALFPEQLDAIRATRRIAEMVDLQLPLGQLRIPHFPVADGETPESWLRKECEAGLARRYGNVTPELQARLDYELGIIVSMGYAGYFLIVADFVRFAREQRIQTTCRGSAPGSIVTYTLGITPVDPIHYELPFERFLNPDRVTMPDIDVDFEVDVDVRHRHPVGVEEPLEGELVVDRIHGRDPQRVRHDRARRAPPAGGLDTLLPGEPDEVGDDQEVAGVPHGDDDPELVLQARLQLRRDVPVAPGQARLALLSEPALGRLAFRHREVRDPELAQRQLEVHHLRDAAGGPDGVEPLGEERRHLRRRLEVERVRLETQPPRRVDVAARPHAQEDVVSFRLGAVDVVEVVRDRERQANLRRKTEQLLVEPTLERDPVVLELQEEVALAQDLAVLAREPASGLPVVDLERLRDLPAQAGGHPDQPLAVPGQVLPVDPRLVVVALEVGVCHEPAQVPVAHQVLGKKDEVVRLGVGLPLLVPHGAPGDVSLHAEDRLDPLRAGRLVEGDRAVERAVIRQGKGIEAKPLRLVHQVADPAEPVEERELRVDVEVRKVVRGEGRHGRSMVARRPGRDRLEAASPNCPRGRSTCIIGPIDRGPRAASQVDLQILFIDRSRHRGRAAVRSAGQRGKL